MHRTQVMPQPELVRRPGMAIQVGRAKSGNAWLYTILRSILIEAGLWRGSFVETQEIYEQAKRWPLSIETQASCDVIDITPGGCYWRIANKYRRRVDDFNSYARKSSLVWTHSRFCRKTPEVISLFQNCFYICRDPRDVAVSMAHFVETAYMQKFRQVRCATDADTYLRRRLRHSVASWVEHVGEHLLWKDDLKLHWIFYERLRENFDHELTSILSHMNIALSSVQRERVRKAASVETMKRSNPGHVRQGKSGGWRTKLTEEQKNTVVRIAGPMLQMLGYASDKDEIAATCLYPETESKERIRCAVMHGRPAWWFRLGRMIMEIWDNQRSSGRFESIRKPYKN